jgi:hypothetical protein
MEEKQLMMGIMFLENAACSKMLTPSLSFWHSTLGIRFSIAYTSLLDMISSL